MPPIRTYTDWNKRPSDHEDQIRKRSALHASQEVEAPVFLFLAGTLISWALGVCLCGKNCSDMVKFWNDGR